MHLVVNGEVALRPMLCRGPFDHRREFTFLFGTTEQQDPKFVQRDAPERAEQNRNDLICHSENRCKHERFRKKKKTLRQSFKDKEYQGAGYVDEFLNAYIATQIKVLREQRGWSQTELGEHAGG